MTPSEHIFRAFPSADRRLEVLSPIDNNYNCIAWAAGITNQFWWPGGRLYWPDPAETRCTVDVFKNVFRARFGYEECPDASLENGFEKVAIYEQAGEVTHMARQSTDGWWLSKLGPAWDVKHVRPECLTSNDYGAPIAYMRRQIGTPAAPPVPTDDG